MSLKKLKSCFLFSSVLVLIFLLFIFNPDARCLNARNNLQFQESSPVSRLIPLAVRVFEGGQFVHDLGLDDFELSLGHQTLNPAGLFLINRQQIERQEGEDIPRPDLTRHIIIMMKMIDYHPQLAQAIQDLFMNEILAGDILEIQTPMKSYLLAPQALEKVPRPVLIKNALELVRKDILQGNMLYNSLLNELKRFARRISGVTTFETEELGGMGEDLGLPFLFQNYRLNMQKLEALRRIDENQLIQFAENLQKRPGQKFIFFLYQREFLPEINPAKMNELQSMYQDDPNIVGELQDLFQQFHRPISFNLPALEEAFASSEAQVNFLFLNKDAPKVAGLVMRERSEDIFKLMSKIARATGGLTEASQNPEAALRKAFTLASKYYLLYFKPEAGLQAGSFTPVTVKVKRENVTVLTRLGFSLPH
jgi:hypothetical protein